MEMPCEVTEMDLQQFLAHMRQWRSIPKDIKVYTMTTDGETGESTYHREDPDFYGQQGGLSPKEVPRLFNPCDAKKILETEMDKELKTVASYDHEVCQTKCILIANQITTALKALGYQKYRYIVNVHVGEFHGVRLTVGTRFEWDNSQDAYASHTFRNKHVFGVAEAFAVSFK